MRLIRKRHGLDSYIYLMSFLHKQISASVAEKNTSVSNIKAKSVIRVILGHQRSKKAQEIWQEYHESVKIAIRFLY